MRNVKMVRIPLCFVKIANFSYINPLQYGSVSPIRWRSVGGPLDDPAMTVGSPLVDPLEVWGPFGIR